MGFIVNGGLAGTNYAKQTAENTKKIAQDIGKIIGQGWQNQKNTYSPGMIPGNQPTPHNAA